MLQQFFMPGDQCVTVSEVTVRAGEDLDSDILEAQLQPGTRLEVVRIGSGRRIQVRSISLIGWISFETMYGDPLVRKVAVLTVQRQGEGPYEEEDSWGGIQHLAYSGRGVPHSARSVACLVPVGDGPYAGGAPTPATYDDEEESRRFQGSQPQRAHQPLAMRAVAPPPGYTPRDVAAHASPWPAAPQGADAGAGTVAFGMGAYQTPRSDIDMGFQSRRAAAWPARSPARSRAGSGTTASSVREHLFASPARPRTDSGTTARSPLTGSVPARSRLGSSPVQARPRADSGTTAQSPLTARTDDRHPASARDCQPQEGVAHERARERALRRARQQRQVQAQLQQLAQVPHYTPAPAKQEAAERHGRGKAGQIGEERRERRGSQPRPGAGRAETEPGRQRARSPRDQVLAGAPSAGPPRGERGCGGACRFARVCSFALVICCVAAGVLARLRRGGTGGYWQRQRGDSPSAPPPTPSPTPSPTTTTPRPHTLEEARERLARARAAAEEEEARARAARSEAAAGAEELRAARAQLGAARVELQAAEVRRRSLRRRLQAAHASSLRRAGLLGALGTVPLQRCAALASAALGARGICGQKAFTQSFNVVTTNIVGSLLLVACLCYFLSSLSTLFGDAVEDVLAGNAPLLLYLLWAALLALAALRRHTGIQVCWIAYVDEVIMTDDGDVVSMRNDLPRVLKSPLLTALPSTG